MEVKRIYQTVNYLVAAVWVANGLFCKVLNLVPRHQQIVASILGGQHANVFTKLIGVAEIGMAIWLLSGFGRQLNVIMQIMVIALMNILELLLASNLLLWGKWNALFAFLFILVLYFNEFYLHKNITRQT